MKNSIVKRAAMIIPFLALSLFVSTSIHAQTALDQAREVNKDQKRYDTPATQGKSELPPPPATVQGKPVEKSTGTASGSSGSSGSGTTSGNPKKEN